MAAIVGILSPDAAGPPPAAWRSAVERLAPRAGPWPHEAATDKVRVAVRAGDDTGWWQDASRAVFVDGQVDNADELAKRKGLVVGGPPSHARVVAALLHGADVEVIGEFTGSFAIVEIDLAAGRARLIRDQFGTRPLVYAPLDGGWCFASEIKALLPLLAHVDIDVAGLGEVIHYRWLVGDRTLIGGVTQVVPTTCATLAPGEPPRVAPYPSLAFAPVEDDRPLEAWVDEADAALHAYFDAVAKRHERVVVLLSGGVDSSLLAAIAQRSLPRAVVMTPRWPAYPNMELDQARRVAEHLKMRHIIVDCDDAYVAGALDATIERMEQPPRSAHSLALNKCLSVAAQEADAIVYGEGADTCFGPAAIVIMRRYARRQALLRWLPRGVRRRLAEALFPAARHRWDIRRHQLLYSTREYAAAILDAIENELPPSSLSAALADEPAPNPTVTALFGGPSRSWVEPFQALQIHNVCAGHYDALGRQAAPHRLTILGPFLSPLITSVAARLPSRHKMQEDFSKPVLRELGARYFPREWMYTRKFGFPTPLGQWLAGPLRPVVDRFKAGDSVLNGILRPEALRTAAERRAQELLWTLVGLESFVRQFVPTAGRGKQ